VNTCSFAVDLASAVALSVATLPGRPGAAAALPNLKERRVSAEHPAGPRYARSDPHVANM
jgi:hypothetical protein